MLRFFLRYPPSALGFGTTLIGLMDEIVPTVPSVTFVLVVPSLDYRGWGLVFFWMGLFSCEGLEV